MVNDESKSNDITGKKISISIRNLAILIVFILGLGASYWDIHINQLSMKCDIRQLKNFMLYSKLPGPNDQCP